jgi:hypothetical protein
MNTSIAAGHDTGSPSVGAQRERREGIAHACRYKRANPAPCGGGI